MADFMLPRCIISNEEIPNDVDAYREVLDELAFKRGSFQRKWNTSIEEAFGQAEARTIPLRVDWFAMFDAMMWTLVPDADTVLQIIRTLMKFKVAEQSATPHQVINQDSYPYIFMPLKLEGMPIQRKTALSREQVLHQDPYNNFPILNLPLHPYAAIVHAHKAFEKFGPLELSNEHLQVYNNIARIWSLWKELEPYDVLPSASSTSSTLSPVIPASLARSFRNNPEEARKASRHIRRPGNPYDRRHTTSMDWASPPKTILRADLLRLR